MSESFLLNTYPLPKACFVSGKGAFLFDDKGKEYLDFLSGIAVVSLGHANDEIATTISNQSSTLGHVSNYFLNEYTEKVASKINEKITFGTNLQEGKVFFANSGAEANECAIKIAKRFGDGKRFKFLTATGSFHGRTLATLAATGQKAKHERFEPLPPYFKYFEINNFQSVVDSFDDEVVAIMLEVIQGENGVRECSAEFLSQVQQLAKEKDLLVIVDEVQTGMCRTGKWFGFQNFNLEPDIVTMAKALGNGFPVGACWSRNEVAESMVPGDHGSTFGGQPLALSVVDNVFSIMERDKLDEKSSELGENLRSRLKSTELFSEVRGRGLLIGCDLDVNVINCDANEFVSRAFERGLVINATSEGTIRIAPPLIIDESHIDRAIKVLQDCAQ